MYLITIILLLGKILAKINLSWFECFIPLIIEAIFWIVIAIIFNID